MEEPYKFTRDDLATLLLRKFYPERTDRESRVIRAWLQNHGAEYDRLSFSVRVGQGHAIDPTLPVGTQKQLQFVSRKRIDVLAWQGTQSTIVEVKYLVTLASLGQILSYRVFFLEDNPNAPDPQLVVIGATGDQDAIRSLQAHDVTVELFPSAIIQDAASGVGQ